MNTMLSFTLLKGFSYPEQSGLATSAQNKDKKTSKHFGLRRADYRQD